MLRAAIGLVWLGAASCALANPVMYRSGGTQFIVGGMRAGETTSSVSPALRLRPQSAAHARVPTLAQSGRVNPCNGLTPASMEALREAARAEGVDERLLMAVAHTESRFNPLAKSPAGAIGLMQLMPATARQYDRNGTANLWDASTNARIGARHLRYLLDLYGGNLALTAAAYNAGEGAVQRYGRKIPPFAETQQYVPQVVGRYLDYMTPKAAGGRAAGCTVR
ncbi:Membrane-bound lytic murein transglycosylase C [Ralstonia mannitolilytica]|uniref:lytic transglycosylase domain-containing protein n=1 Tax=Ralstonia mannitolilytica TaxID=105219 RepID=UPI000A459289|nr:lytic transglycosylase domain-containing protein [Ralstonia mannitolilytica]CAJ0693985.1 Membrane-bound lytic murein transglycosylase C [Ralstonia mannitolilytica]CAJ0891005.1 Membrane-bound lytic murein transglycosylase C [Ralstonia mannitolilytica]